MYNIAETCEADFTCYVKECSSENGPQALMEGLKVTPNTPVFAAVRLLYEQQLEDMKCPYVSSNWNDSVLGQKRYCCPDMVTDETMANTGENLDLTCSAILPGELLDTVAGWQVLELLEPKSTLGLSLLGVSSNVETSRQEG